ncbi:branched-chain amino acid ABC transporter permease/ATP-binding protein [Acuticoccus sediminis]|uniref:Branched-chain amino acid ABC transporter permease/ATP-binding protein n=1 Tax=Acuticoccus sediminis TaxID=2184697 RepID=A0A8B2NRG8_9HYPH|nr:branched-chain amino acid ABC transporter ATP-binding protein/permease [Acuticoccus sediminis]RAI02476.1 branched-chain amino acid ABC transporter permease/ATP-binding protein [Acuticoccus sediminis]
MTKPLRAAWPEIALLAVLILAPVVLPPLGFSVDLLSRVLNWGLFGLGFDLLFGLTGLLSFGQAAFYGTGGFVAAYLLVSGSVGSVWLAFLIGTLAAGVFALLVGWLAVRRVGIYFTMITLAFGQMAYFMENSPLSDYTGGENGIAGVPVPRIGFGESAIAITAGWPMYILLAVVFFVGFVIARRIARSPVGAVLRAIKENTPRVAMLGHDVRAYKITVFVVAALYAGLAGAMLGSFQSYMPPDAFSLETSGQLVIQTIIGGAGTLIGPVVGSTLWLWLRDNLQLIEGIGAAWKLILGIVFIALVIGLRRGICGEIVYLVQRRRAARAAKAAPERPATGRPAAAPALALPLASPEGASGEVALEAVGLSRHYGGLKAVDDVSFKIRKGTIHGVIGPNGAGKSTLFKMLLDEVRPSHGEVRLFGKPISGLGPSRVAQLGVAKSNQLNQLFLNLTVRQNLRIAALARRRGALRLDMLRPAASFPDVEEQVERLLATLALTENAEKEAHVMAYGEKRRLEIGMALATSPNVLLLDEPLAGMSPAERLDARALIKDIAQSRTLVIVEHDLDAMFGLAQHITVLYEGRLLADASPEVIRRDPAVHDAYLGGLHADEPA